MFQLNRGLQRGCGYFPTTLYLCYKTYERRMNDGKGIN